MEELVSRRSTTALDGRAGFSAAEKGFAFCSCVAAVLLCLGIPFTAALLVVLGFTLGKPVDPDDRLINFMAAIGILWLVELLCYIVSCIVYSFEQSVRISRDFCDRKNQARCNVLDDATLPQPRPSGAQVGAGTLQPLFVATYCATYFEDYTSNNNGEDPIHMTLQLPTTPFPPDIRCQHGPICGSFPAADMTIEARSL
jgi:hypothetical protein